MKDNQNNKRQYTHPHVDTLKLARRRHQLAADIAAKGITDEHVLDAISRVPRHLFMPDGMENSAYIDRPFPIGEGQTISQPYTVAYQTQLLNVQPYDKILEVGTGSAYQAAILAEMGAEVYTIERQKKLYDRNRHFQFLRSFPNLHFCYGDGFRGWRTEAPFDKILITAAPEVLPLALTRQLRIGGLMVAPVGRQGSQRMVRVTREANGQLYEELFDHFSFVPMLEGKV
jgi:protein-L-isoaspartate(D-aspartate) O-methyltransferase